jgi:hypothetical protein
LKPPCITVFSLQDLERTENPYTRAKEARDGRVGVGSRLRTASSDTNLLGQIGNRTRIYSTTIKNSKTEESRHHNEEIY